MSPPDPLAGWWREKLQGFGLPAHCRIDAVATARMIEKHPLLDAAGVHFAVFREMNGGLDTGGAYQEFLSEDVQVQS
jgi:hypothetical protein